jgi:hypothetical protein
LPEIAVERASVCPIRDKRHFNFNTWTASTTLCQLLDKTQTPPRDDDPDILFIDRGIFDAVCWLMLLEGLERITLEDRAKADAFFLIKDWTSWISGVIAMSTTPEDALEREQGLLPVEGSGGSIMNPVVLRQMGNVIRLALQLHFSLKAVAEEEQAKGTIMIDETTCARQKSISVTPRSRRRSHPPY